MFLVRIAFWVTVVALLLPTPDSANRFAGSDGSAISASLSEGSSASADSSVDMSELAGAAIESAEDILTFCDRNPATCDTGRAVAAHVQRQVSYYAGLALSWIAEQNASGADNPDDGAQHHREGPFEASAPSAKVLRGA